MSVKIASKRLSTTITPASWVNRCFDITPSTCTQRTTFPAAQPFVTHDGCDRVAGGMASDSAHTGLQERSGLVSREVPADQPAHRNQAFGGLLGDQIGARR